MFSVNTVWDNIDKVRGSGPVVLSITNYVVMNSTANALLSAGASPIMAHAKEELEELITIAGSLVLNIGTLSTGWIDSMRFAASIAAAKYKPVVLDPVGAGASRLRTETSISLLEEGCVSLVRGNASEIMALAGVGAMTRGVDSCNDSNEAETSAKTLARKYQCAVAVSGCVDLITDGETVYNITGGSDYMPLVTGMGCIATAICGAHLAICEDSFAAAVSGMGCMAAAGGLAKVASNGPGTFAVHFIDALHNVTENDITRLVEVRSV
ncbi:hydroxyethylthiazole kinase [Halodesulfovibrio aestuarii]|uniref:Hydroxyethylthiazole kinase n=1 Tax=Halodesulfovibrio aestuarii TaxID=126333 RepID=A0A8G2FBR9_9BACT|nr:hydroxyethylthiazole kinase [Halodesulfovibrio aestuarii]SHJ49615.1 hydroxyethylthiazole kinase [Halodesulfovibrio aestuarii]